MTEALAEARAAREQGEIPIGAVIVKDGVIIGRGHNMTLTQKDPTAHAEILAIRQAGTYLGETLGWKRLTGCSMYVTMQHVCGCYRLGTRGEALYRRDGSKGRRLRIGV